MSQISTLVVRCVRVYAVGLCVFPLSRYLLQSLFLGCTLDDVERSRKLCSFFSLDMAISCGLWNDAA